MAHSIDILKNNDSIEVSDVAANSLDISDITLGTNVIVVSDSNVLDGSTIVVDQVFDNILAPTDVNVSVDISPEKVNTVNIDIINSNVVDITDNISFPIGSSAPRTIISSPFGTAENGNVGLNIVDPQFNLQISGSLFAPIMSTSTMQINGDGTSPLFAVKLNDDEEARFVINLQGVTMLGQFFETPDVVAGGMFYSASGDFYLGY